MNDLIEVKAGEMVISSLSIAREFGKRHDNVLRTIRNTLKDSLGNFNKISGLNIEEADFIDKNGEAQPLFVLSEQAVAVSHRSLDIANNTINL